MSRGIFPQKQGPHAVSVAPAEIALGGRQDWKNVGIIPILATQQIPFSKGELFYNVDILSIQETNMPSHPTF